MPRPVSRPGGGGPGGQLRTPCRSLGDLPAEDPAPPHAVDLPSRRRRSVMRRRRSWPGSIRGNARLFCGRRPTVVPASHPCEQTGIGPEVAALRPAWSCRSDQLWVRKGQGSSLGAGHRLALRTVRDRPDDDGASRSGARFVAQPALGAGASWRGWTEGRRHGWRKSHLDWGSGGLEHPHAEDLHNR